MAAGAVEIDAGVAPGPLRAVVGQQERLFDGRDDDVERDVTLTFEGAQGGEVDVHQSSWSLSRANSTWTRARAMSA